MYKQYDAIVIGAGHAGCEAAYAASKMGCSTLLFTIDLDKIATMSCSPSIGGTGKGQLVKEIDALGGIMAKISDISAIQYKTLNTKKGVAVQSSRTQNDKMLYHSCMKRFLERCSNLDIKQALIKDIVVENKKIKGVTDSTGFFYPATTLVICSGTFLNGLIHIGDSQISAGRAGEMASIDLAKSLFDLGFELGRMKTGTPPRLDRDTIDFSKFIEHQSDDYIKPLSFTGQLKEAKQIPSYIGRTTDIHRKIILDNLKKSALYSGRIKGVAARYCPSFEDKTVRFPHKTEHRIILEPEGFNTKEIYASGLGNSMPMDVQLKFVRATEGLEEVEIMRPAYAIEYDFVNPLQLKMNLESKLVENLFLAGQINGTSGYEEAAAQGLWAGVNAACKICKKDPFILDRSQSYIGVMVDDLVTRGTKEPYRIFTSRAEYRLMLREDNADLRLSEIGYEYGLVDKASLERVKELANKLDCEIKRVKKIIVKPTLALNDYLIQRQSKNIKTGIKASQLLKRSELDYDFIDKFFPNDLPISDRVKNLAEIEIKYEGYIKRQLSDISKFKDLEKIKIPKDFDYNKINGLSNEIKEKLIKIRPESIGQASRIDGITPVALSILRIAIKAKKNA